MSISPRGGGRRAIKIGGALAGFLFLAIGYAQSGTFEDQVQHASEEIRASQTAARLLISTEMKPAPAQTNGHSFRECWKAGYGYAACRADGHSFKECWGADGGYAACRADGRSFSDSWGADIGYAVLTSIW